MAQIGAPAGSAAGEGQSAGASVVDDDLWVADSEVAPADLSTSADHDRTALDPPGPVPGASGGVPTRPGGARGQARARRQHPWSIRQRLGGATVAAAGVAVVVATMVHARVALYREDFGISWQLLEQHALEKDPLGSVWYLHIQPPLHNLVIGSVLRWSPFPAMGTILVLYVASLLAIALLLTDLLSRWRVHPVLAGLFTAIALCNPNLLSTIVVASYEVPVTLLLVASVWWFQRQLQDPGLASLLGLSVSLTALAMTRSLFHPAFVVAVVVLAAVARRIPWRQVALASAIPILVIGGWMLKNDILFGTPTMSSWLGFNLQRGVVAPMARDDVQAAVDDGTVSSLALEHPWGLLSQYEEWTDGCTPVHRNPVVSVADRPDFVPVVANFNDECYLPVYAQSQKDAVALVKRYPGRYLRTRVTVVGTSFAMSAIGVGKNDFAPSERPSVRRTWMDDVGDVVLVSRHWTVRQGDWNLPLLHGVDLPVRSSLLLAALFLGLLVRGGLAGVRLARSGWRDRVESWDTDELVWAFVAVSAVLVVLVGDLLEFGENGRFRSMLDPFLVALPLAALARIVSGRLAARRPQPTR
ncbi:hypothetical protein KSP35_17755 [Aquihabitans sp. G128]|uniref:hypothetical protein n=1 Tax=Aquihabitans sp. G128 TaxID=2849779 RepID=UPI001C2513CA|nr:hypothetical protein [Aquihabitans sp. G128]QXC60177.1 hypothetical protein KSP35_17755 [Aquihabitans sp. G128]